jgi:penicillin amidase
LLLAIVAYLGFRASLPAINDAFSSKWVKQETKIGRDKLGTAQITANSLTDAAFALGYAHAQDRLFQMDLLRRSAAGELSEIVGNVALNLDKKARFHQFRKRALQVLTSLPEKQRVLLSNYTEGVNLAASRYTIKPFEYLLTDTEFKAWVPEDSLLVIYSMYLDLQGGQVEMDLVNTFLVERFGYQLLHFFNLPSPYQAALDGSIVSAPIQSIPTLSSRSSGETKSMANIKKGILAYDAISEPLDIGSNNWAVTGKLSHSKGAMLSDDMHLGLRVPPIWYRAQLNYVANNKNISVTGVSLPGTPTIIVGSNGHIAWGFTNANLDNVDWVKLDNDTKTTLINEIIKTKHGEETLQIEMSEFGPVRTLNASRYALAWVAHKEYAVNIAISDMAQANNLKEGFAIADNVRIPVQNLMIADADGNAGWRPIGAVTARTTPSLNAINQEDYSALWLEQEQDLPTNVNPNHGRLWTANSRVISAKDLARYGNGGYSIGARALQIRDRLFSKNKFTEQDFYDIQLDNEARFIMPWHTKLSSLLNRNPTDYSNDIKILDQWKTCACNDSIAYTLVRRFRSTVINSLLAPIYEEATINDLSLSNSLRGIEPAIWQILDQKSLHWLPTEFKNYDEFLLASYQDTKIKLIKKYNAGPSSLKGLEWGNVNKLKVQHPFASQLGPLAAILNMPEVEGFGDSYMPAVQSSKFGASQRLIVRPGDEESGILTIPGGQSAHPLSPYYSAGFIDYAQGKNTPLLPNKIEHLITITPSK